MIVRKIDTFSGHRDSVYSLIRDKEPNRLFSAGADGQVVRWDLQKPDLGELVASVQGTIYALAYDRDSGNLWIGQNYDGIQLVNPETKEFVASSKIANSVIFDIQLYDDNAYLALGDGVIIVMDIASFAIKKHIKASHKSVRTLAVNPTSQEVAAGFSDWNISVFDRNGAVLKKTFPAHANSVFVVKYSPDGRFLLSAGRDAHIKIWDVANNYELIEDIPAHLFTINHLTYSPDGSLFATCSMDKSIKVWDAESFKLLKVIDRARHAGHGTSVNKLLWTSYNDVLLSCSDDRTVSVWKLE